MGMIKAPVKIEGMARTLQVYVGGKPVPMERVCGVTVEFPVDGVPVVVIRMYGPVELPEEIAAAVEIYGKGDIR